MNDSYIGSVIETDEQSEYDNWAGAQQADDDQRRHYISECWQRIKRGEYTDRDLMTIERELRNIL